MTNTDIIKVLFKDFGLVYDEDEDSNQRLYTKTLKALYNEFVNEYGNTKEFVTSVFNISVIKDIVDLDRFNKAVTETLGA